METRCRFERGATTHRPAAPGPQQQLLFDVTDAPLCAECAPSRSLRGGPGAASGPGGCSHSPAGRSKPGLRAEARAQPARAPDHAPAEPDRCGGLDHIGQQIAPTDPELTRSDASTNGQ
jgi:hypothetical protein